MSEEMPMKVVPQPTSLSQPYWDACRQGVLKLQQCQQCHSYQFYPRVICSHCSSRDLEWQVVSGQGVIKSFTVVRRGISKAYEAPYVVALVELNEGPSMMSSIVDVEPESVQVGAKVAVDFESWGQDIAMPVFRLMEGN